MAGYSEEELEFLTPEERAGLENPDDNQDDNTSSAADGSDDDADDDQDQDDEHDDADDDEEGDDADGEGDGDDAEGDDDADDDSQPGRDDGADPDQPDESGTVEAPNPDRPVIPEFTREEPKDADTKLEDIDKREDALTEKFDEGDLTSSEYRAELRKLSKERDDVQWSVRSYQQAKERHEEEVGRAQGQFMEQWFKTAADYVAEHPEIKRNATVMQVFDNIVQGLNTEENINKYSHRTRLEMAHKQWAEDLGLPVQPPAKNGKPQGKKPAPPKKRDLPPSLSNVPAAAVAETDKGAFGTIDRLFNSSNPKDVAKAEDMLSKMSEAEQDKYLRSN